eukprot:2310856-Rhodomonas_salina.1
MLLRSCYAKCGTELAYGGTRGVVGPHGGQTYSLVFAHPGAGCPIPYTLHPTPYTLHPTSYTVRPISYTLHPIPYTLHTTHYTLRPRP